MKGQKLEKINNSFEKNKSNILSISLISGISLVLVIAIILFIIFFPKFKFGFAFPSSTDVITATDTHTDTSMPTGSAVPESSAEESSVVSSNPEASVVSNVSSTTSSAPPTVTTNNIINYKERQTYSSMWNGIENLCKEYPEILSYSVYGKSTKGRSLPLVKMGSGSKKGLIVAGIHGNEHLTTAYALRCIEEYCHAYENGGKLGNYDIKTLFSKYSLYVVPNCNPDGSEIAHNGDSPLVAVNGFNRNEYKANANGVNLNRNFPFCFDGINLNCKTPNNQNYKGPSGGSEIETKELMDLCNEHSFSFMLSLHIKGNITYWSDVVTKNAGGITSGLCSEIQKVTGIQKTSSPTSNPSSYGGGFENWFRYTYNCPGICVELMPSSYTVSGNSSANEQNFDNTTVWHKTKYLFALTMNYV